MALLLSVAVFAAEAQQPSKVPRIGMLDAQALGPDPDNAFREGLRQFGYVEGKNIAIEWRRAHARAERFPELAADLVRLKVVVIVAANNPAVAAAQRATTTIPIVMILATDPVRLGS
jgi:putative ABC transport system substrate-binding protein